MSDTLFVGSFGDRKLKRKIEESSTMEKDTELSLSLSLGGNYMVHESSSKPAFKILKSNEDSGFDPNVVENSVDKEVIKPKEQQFSCKFCDKKFPNPQALGGHQNAHKRERILSRMEREFSMSPFGLRVHSGPYSSIANHHHFYGSPIYHEGQMQPMAHMSPMPWHTFEIGTGNNGLYNTYSRAHQFGMTSNSLVTNAETPQRLNQRDVNINREHDQVPSLAGDVANRSNTTHGGLEGLRRNYYTRNH